MLSRYIERKLKTILKDKDWSSLKALLESHKRKPKTGFRRKGLEAKRKAHADSTGAIHAVVMHRACGNCENCGWFGALEMDHWLGGSGRRRQLQSHENCWALCRWCHADKTANAPDARYWNRRFKLHCKCYGYPFTPHIEHAPVTKVSADGALAPKASGGTP